MGKRSVKANKNIYQISRENAGLTREKASELMDYISADRIEKIESEKSFPRPDEILTMSKCYKSPTLCNYFCSHECEIGQEYVPELKTKDLERITLELISRINAVHRQKDRLIDIAVDGRLTEDEYEDFARIHEQLSELSMSVDSLRLWMDQMVMDDVIDQEKLDKAYHRVKLEKLR